MRTLKIIGTALYVIFTGVLLFIFLTILPDLYTSEDGWAVIGGVLMMAITLVGSAAYLIPIILSAIGLYLAMRANADSEPNDGKAIKKSKIHFFVLILLSLITPALNLIAYLIILKN